MATPDNTPATIPGSITDEDIHDVAAGKLTGRVSRDQEPADVVYTDSPALSHRSVRELPAGYDPADFDITSDDEIILVLTGGKILILPDPTLNPGMVISIVNGPGITNTEVASVGTDATVAGAGPADWDKSLALAGAHFTLAPHGTNWVKVEEYYPPAS